MVINITYNININARCLNEKLEFSYKNEMDRNSLIDKLELNSSKYSNLELILKIFDNIYKKGQISLEKDDENSCHLLITILNPFDEKIVNKIKLYKKYMNDNDKYNFLLSKIQSIQNGNNNINVNEEFVELKNKVN